LYSEEKNGITWYWMKLKISKILKARDGKLY